MSAGSNASHFDGLAGRGSQRRPRIRFHGRWVPAGHQYREAFLARLLHGILRPFGLHEAAFPSPGSQRVGEGPVKRAGGRWIPAGARYLEKRSVVRPILARAWLLLVPFVGIGWVNSAHVRPVVEDFKSQKNFERQALLDAQDELKVEISRIQSRIAETEALIDTFHMPQLIVRQATLDETIRLRMAYDRNPVQLAAEVDSLRIIRDYLQVETDDLAAQLNGRQAILANLDVWNGAMRDSIATLDQQIADRLDQLERRERRAAMHAALGRFWYVLGPAVGIVWAHES